MNLFQKDNRYARSVWIYLYQCIASSILLCYIVWFNVSWARVLMVNNSNNNSKMVWYKMIHNALLPLLAWPVLNIHHTHKPFRTVCFLLYMSVLGGCNRVRNLFCVHEYSETSVYPVITATLSARWWALTLYECFMNWSLVRGKRV